MFCLPGDGGPVFSQLHISGLRVNELILSSLSSKTRDKTFPGESHLAWLWNR